MQINLLKCLIPATLACTISLQAQAQSGRTPAPPTLRATINLTVGGADEAHPENEFGVVSGLAFDAKGQILVSDYKENRVNVFSSSGKLLYRIGRKGAGPGDLTNPTDIEIAADGRLWVRDHGNHRFQVFDVVPPSGKSVTVVPFLTNDGATNRVHWDPAGHVVEVTHAKNTAPNVAFRVMRQFLDNHGVVVATDTAPPVSTDSVETWLFTTRNGSSTFNKPFAAQRLATYGNGGNAAYATNTNYAVRLVDAKGKQIALLQQTVAPVALSAADEATVSQLIDMIAKGQKVPPSELKFDRPTTKPAIAQLFFDMDGRLWVERSVVTGAPHVADLYARDGKWLSVMQWPADVELRHGAVKGNVGLGVAKDADGLQRVVRLNWK